MKDLTNPRIAQLACDIYKLNPVEVFGWFVEPLSETTRYIQDFIREKCIIARGKGIIGISGGIDSAVVGKLAVNALGKENVYGLFMNSKTNTKQDHEDQIKTVEWLGIDYREVPAEKFDAIIKTYQDAIGFFNNSNPKGNLKARIRMSFLYGGANNGLGRVLGTGNRSEIMIGYSTKYGDGGVDFNPIGDLYKTQVRKVAAYIGVPKNIITKPPAAGLGISKSDEDEIGVTYEHIDKILLGKDLDFSNEEIIRYGGVTVEEIQNIKKRFETSYHKRDFPDTPRVIKYSGSTRYFEREEW